MRSIIFLKEYDRSGAIEAKDSHGAIAKIPENNRQDHYSRLTKDGDSVVYWVVVSPSFR